MRKRKPIPKAKELPKLPWKRVVVKEQPDGKYELIMYNDDQRGTSRLELISPDARLPWRTVVAYVRDEYKCDVEFWMLPSEPQIIFHKSWQAGRPWKPGNEDVRHVIACDTVRGMKLANAKEYLAESGINGYVCGPGEEVNMSILSATPCKYVVMRVVDGVVTTTKVLNNPGGVAADRVRV